MHKLLLRLVISLLLLAPTLAAAQNPHASCISSHFHRYQGASGSVQVISIERLKKWPIWCQHGYNAQKLQQAITPCYQQTVTQLRANSTSYLPITFQKSQKIRISCKQQIWQKLRLSTNNHKS